MDRTPGQAELFLLHSVSFKLSTTGHLLFNIGTIEAMDRTQGQAELFAQCFF
jgi:hypothetical protein